MPQQQLRLQVSTTMIDEQPQGTETRISELKTWWEQVDEHNNIEVGRASISLVRHNIQKGITRQFKIEMLQDCRKKDHSFIKHNT